MGFLQNILHNYQNRRQLRNWQMQGIRIGKNCLFEKGVEMRLKPFFYSMQEGAIELKDNSKLSKGCILDCFGGSISIGSNVFFGPYCVLYGHGNITIGNDCLIAMGCKIIAGNHTIPQPHSLIRLQPDIAKPVYIGNDVWLGADVKVLAGVRIGDGCVVGAGSVVINSLPPYSIAVGVPAKVIKMRK